MIKIEIQLITVTVEIKNRQYIFTIDESGNRSRVYRNLLTEHMKVDNKYTLAVEQMGTVKQYNHKKAPMIPVYHPVSFNKEYISEIKARLEETQFAEKVAYVEKQLMWVEKNLENYLYTNGARRFCLGLKDIIERDPVLAKSLNLRFVELIYRYLCEKGRLKFLIDMEELVEAIFTNMKKDFDGFVENKEYSYAKIKIADTVSNAECLCIYTGEIIDMLNKAIEMEVK